VLVLCVSVHRVNVDRSGAISLRQFHTWAKQVAMSGRDAEETEARADIPFSVFVPLLMLLNFTAVPFQLNALEFVVMVRIYGYGYMVPAAWLASLLCAPLSPFCVPW